MLQQHNNAATVAHMLLANRILRRAQSNLANAGLHFPPLKWPLRLVSIADAGHATSSSSFAQESQIRLLTGDRMTDVRVSSEIVAPNTLQSLGGPSHVLSSRVGKSKRITHSTSHAETITACTSSSTAQMIAMRLTEIFHNFTSTPHDVPQTRLQQLIMIQD